MTNLIIAVVSIQVVTNWTPIAHVSYLPRGTNIGPDVIERGNLLTNTTVAFDWNGQSFELRIYSEAGPTVGEKRRPWSMHWDGQIWTEPRLTWGSVTNSSGNPMTWR